MLKLVTKRLFCSSCGRLVKAQERRTDGNASITCSRCGRLLWTTNGITWRYQRGNR